MPTTAGDDGETRLAGVRLTNPGKLLYPEEGITKIEIAQYYLRVADRIMPHLQHRLVSLVRCPQGSETTCFFQRHGSRGFPEQFRHKSVTGGKASDEEYLYITEPAGLVAAAQVGVLELHIWGSRVQDVERPDRIVFDLDPDAGLHFNSLKEAAVHIRDVLREKAGLTAFVMATGGKGLHLVCPVEARHEWPEVKAATRAFAEMLATQWPERYTANIRKAARRGRIFVDYLRNDRTATAICPYSTRNKPGAPVAVPLTWRGLGALSSADPITLRDSAAIEQLVAQNPWKDYANVRQQLPADQLTAGSQASRRRKPGVKRQRPAQGR